MSEVTLRIGGRSYNVSCHDGEEAHILHLGSMIDAKIEAMGANRAPQESQNLLFAALFLADELHEAKSGSGKAEATLFETGNAEELRAKVETLEKERNALSQKVDELERAAENATAQQPTQDFSALLEEVAESLEKCADTLESGALAS